MTIDRKEYEEVQHRLHKTNITFFHSPAMWRDCTLPVELEWVPIKFNEANRSLVPSDDSGVYVFMLQPDFPGPPNASYLLYIGETNRFRRRYGEYLREQRKTNFVRGRISYMLERWADHLWFYYASIAKNDLRKQIEDDLINACIPPYNIKLKGTIKEAISAFARGG